MVEEKGLSDEVADEVGKYVLRSGTMREVMKTLKSDQRLDANENVRAGLTDIDLLVSYLEALNVADKVSFDLSLARGLDYYTGLIYEVIPDTDGRPTHVGSIAAGGRYDNLVGMYGNQPVSCVGISFRIDRIYTLLDAQREKGGKNSELAHETDVYIMAFGGKDFDGLLLEHLKVARELWDVGIRTEFTAKVKPRPQQQFMASDKSLIVVILG
jgi:histidyl-tRNA synthetase